MQALRSDVDAIQERLGEQENATEAQAELIMQLTRSNAILVRWLLYLTIGISLSGMVATAGVLLAVLI